MVPMLTMMFLEQGMTTNDAIHLALGTSMASIVATSWSSMRKHHAQSGVRWDVWRMMLPGLCLGILMGAALATHVDGHYLGGFFACFMLFMAYKMFSSTSANTQSHPLKAWQWFGSGIPMGAISALLSIGGGIMAVPFLLWQGVTMRQAIGTAAALGFPIACLGTFSYILFSEAHHEIWGAWGWVHVPIVFIISSISYWSISYGVLYAQKLDALILKRLFAMLLLMLSGNMMSIVYHSCCS